VLYRLNPLIRLWSNYFPGVVAKRHFAALDSWTFRKELHWARRTHPRKSFYRVRRKYWGKLHRQRDDPWVFGDAEGQGGRLVKFAWTLIVRHVLVKGAASPDDPSLQDYWAYRRWRRHAELSGPHRALAMAQRELCPHSGESLHNDEARSVHYIQSLQLGGARISHNQRLMHHICQLQAFAAAMRARDRKQFA